MFQSIHKMVGGADRRITWCFSYQRNLGVLVSYHRGREKTRLVDADGQPAKLLLHVDSFVTMFPVPPSVTVCRAAIQEIKEKMRKIFFKLSKSILAVTFILHKKIRA